MGRLPWTLADFPQGYILLLHLVPRKTRSFKPRRDFYLYGARPPHSPFRGRSRTHTCMNEYTNLRAYLRRRRVGSTDVASFASPLEFVKHAKWLMQGAHRTLDTHRSPRCKCKYCNRDDGGDNQRVISRELNRVRARVLAQIDGDEVQDNEDDAVVDAEAGAEADADAEVRAEVEVEVEAEAEAEAEAKVVIAETATAVPATDQGGHAGGDGN
jgi:hypothetical protein